MFRRKPRTPPLSAKQLRRKNADRVAQERGAKLDARTYFNQVQLVKGIHLQQQAKQPK